MMQSRQFSTKSGNKPKFVLDADIKSCFDRIDHQALLRKLNTFPTLHRQIRAWLKAGVDAKQLFPTSEGTPKGCIAHLGKCCLHGIENRIKQAFPRRTLHQVSMGYQPGAALIRFADDFVRHEANCMVREHLLPAVGRQTYPPASIRVRARWGDNGLDRVVKLLIEF